MCDGAETDVDARELECIDVDDRDDNVDVGGELGISSRGGDRCWGIARAVTPDLTPFPSAEADVIDGFRGR